MANQTYTTGSERGTYVDRNDNRLLRMLIPFIVGLVLGWGVNEMIDSGNTNRVQSGGTGTTQTP